LKPVARLVIGTRGSALALWQARHVAALLRSCHADLEIEERVIATEGDEVPPGRGAPAALGRVGVFVRRIEKALIAGDVDLAVHSLKDLPTEQPDGLIVAAVPERQDARDALVSREGWTLAEVPAGTMVGTGSPRRRCQLLHHRPDLEVAPVRGNVDTRMRKLREGEVGALVLAVAGIDRLGLGHLPMQVLDESVCVPAVGQGALALEIRESDATTAAIVEPLRHAASTARIDAERAFLRRLGGGCLAPATAHARMLHERLYVEAMVGDPSGTSLLLERENGEPGEAAAIGARLAQRLRVAGADRILAAARGASDAEHDDR
jgi:hydroxymethylbilane synthase